jgi:hypothetical protein
MIDYRIASNAAGIPVFWLARNSDNSTIQVFNLNGTEQSRCPYGDWDTVLQELKNRNDMAGGQLHVPTLNYGEFHPRIARLWDFGPDWEIVPGSGTLHPYFFYHHARERRAAHLAALLLFDRLAELLKVIEPVAENAQAFGHASRQLLVLACTEVEASWRGVLEANEYSNSKTGNRFNTCDYVKLLKPMRLCEWEVKLVHHSNWPAMRPFANWSAASPTKSLDWYNAYNQVKHDREDKLRCASLKNVLDAMAAMVVMAWATFGELVICKESVPLTALFRATARPCWRPNEVYYGPGFVDQYHGWTPVKFNII